MKTIQSMLAATILALYTFCAACWYAPSVIFDSVMPFVFVALSRVPSGCVCVVQTPPGAGVSDRRPDGGYYCSVPMKTFQ